MGMNGSYGSYPISREASGTSWQPDSTPHEGLHIMSGDWMVMVHGYADGIYDRQGGPRGQEKGFSESMLMIMAQRQLGGGTLGLRGMGSLDPAMGPSGYPLLLQTGETADGKTALIDRQHPHDLFMELAATYSHPLTDDSSVFGYFGLPGEPALGPTVFMHRFSGMDNPEAADHASLARFDARHVRRRDVGLCLARCEARRFDVPRPRARSISLGHREAVVRFVLGAAHVESHE